MDASRFDEITRALSAQRSRRSTIAGAAGVAALGVLGAAAHDATPEASPLAMDGGGTPFMFVQTFGAGSIDAATDGVPLLLLVADHLAGQTLYFSDRPERMVGMVPTEDFLTGGAGGTGLGFTPSDPPNAALVLPDGKMLVVELIDPQYDAESGQVRYQMKILEDVTQIDLELQSEPLSGADAVGDFSAASLFIDDCPNGTVECYSGGSGDYVGSVPGSGVMGFCWDSNDLCCLPCGAPTGGGGDWDAGCNHAYPSQCNGSCYHQYNAAFSCANE